jgi:Transglycosylase SLT domain
MWCRGLLLMIALVAWSIVVDPTAGAQPLPTAKPHNVAALVKALIRKNSKNVEVVTFADRRLPPVKVVRGKREPPPPTRHGMIETVTFSDKHKKPVRIIRGGTEVAILEIATAAPTPVQPSDGAKVEIVSFADPRERPVTVLRGSAATVINIALFAAPRITSFDLFSAARGADLDRVAFAVDGAESSHGTDPAMWRLEFSGAQGPMQVSAAAAIDSGGGDRFDPAQNRLLGRAYLGRLYRRYGNWPDTIAAYNWGPGNMDAWINEGRPGAALPIEVERYRDRVLRNGP